MEHKQNMIEIIRTDNYDNIIFLITKCKHSLYIWVYLHTEYGRIVTIVLN